MDTIAYLPDPATATKMISVVNEHARFSVKSARIACVFQASNYDEYDHYNDSAASAFLLDSLEETLQQKIEDKADDDD